MDNNTPLSLGEKIRYVRVAKGLSQENLAHATGKSKALISRLERGDSEFDETTLANIKKCLRISNAPLLEHELEIFTTQIWAFHDLVQSHRVSEAEAMQHELAQILELPYERDLIIMYKMISAKLEGRKDISVAKLYLSEVEPLLDGASEDAIYLYRTVKGHFCDISGDYEGAVNHFLGALEYCDKKQISDAILIFSIARNYSLMGRLILAKDYFERTKREYVGDRTHPIVYAVDNALGFCYMQLGSPERAKELFESSVIRARSLNDKRWLGLSLSNLGTAYYNEKRYELGLKFVEESLEYLQGELEQHLGALIGKAKCLIGLKNHPRCEEVLNYARSLTNEERHIIDIEATRHRMTIKDNSSTQYLETIALPYYRAQSGEYIASALEICDILEKQYRKREATKKADTIAIISRDIYRRMIFGPNGTRS